MNNVKGIYLIADGLGDRPIAELNGLTPLEYANTPTMDLLCKEGSTGLVHPYRPGCRVGTDWGHICLFGYNPDEHFFPHGHSARLETRSSYRYCLPSRWGRRHRKN